MTRLALSNRQVFKPSFAPSLRSALFTLAAVVLLLLPGVMVFGALRVRVATFAQIAAEHSQWIQQSGIPSAIYVVVATLSELGIFVVFGTVAVLLYSRKRNDLDAVFVAVMLANTGAVILRYTDPMEWLPMALRDIAMFTTAVATASSVSFVIVFPRTHYMPRLMRWSAYLWCVTIALWYGVQRFSANYTFPMKYVPPILMLVGIGGSLLFQIYRYTRLANGIQRQQAKWLVYGTASAALGFLLYQIVIPIFFPTVLQVGLPRLIYVFGGMPIVALIVVLMPLSIAFAVLRYRLWDIGRLANRALVYGILTFGLLLVFVGSVTVLQQVFRMLTGSRSVWAIVLATAIIAKLVEPLRGGLQHAIDMRFHRERNNATLIFSNYSNATRDEIDLTRISERLLAAVEQTAHPTQMALWVRPKAMPNKGQLP